MLIRTKHFEFEWIAGGIYVHFGEEKKRAGGYGPAWSLYYNRHFKEWSFESLNQPPATSH